MTILKIIGIVILLVLGLVLLALLLVLLVPVRYSLSGSYGSGVKGKAKVTWFLHALSVGVTYEDGLDIVVRILGKRLFQKKEQEPFLPEEEPDMGICSLEPGESDGSWADGEEFVSHEETSPEEEFVTDDKPAAETPKRKKKRTEKTGKKNSDSRKEKINLTERFQGLTESFKEKWNRIGEYKERVTAFVTDEENKKTFRLIWRQFRAVIRHILPTKVRGTLVFGFEDPAVTGNVLAALSILYAWYGDALRITPVFDEKILEMEGSLKGRIRAGTLLVLLIRILLNKNFRVLVRRWRKKRGI